MFAAPGREVAPVGGVGAEGIGGLGLRDVVADEFFGGAEGALNNWDEVHGTEF